MDGLVYHDVLNRDVERMRLFADAPDFAAFERVAVETLERVDARRLPRCVTPNHWRLLLRPRRGRDEALSQFMRRLTATPTQHWPAHRRSAGTEPTCQGQYKIVPGAER